MKLTLALIGIILGAWLVWPSGAEDPIELEGAPEVVWLSTASADTLPPVPLRLVTWAELDSILALYVLPLRPAADDPGVEWVDDPRVRWIPPQPPWFTPAARDSIAIDTTFYKVRLFGSHPAWLAPLRQGAPYCGVTVEGR